MNTNEDKTHDKVMIFKSRQVSFIVSGALGVICCAFIVGYFVGKKDFFSYELTQNLRAIPLATFDNVFELRDTGPINTSAQADYSQTKEGNSLNETSVEHDQQKLFYANLISFATKKHADQFVNRLASQGIATEIKERKSSSNAESVSTWYQVVTTPSSDKNELKARISLLTKQENLQGVTIVTYT